MLQRLAAILTLVLFPCSLSAAQLKRDSQIQIDRATILQADSGMAEVIAFVKTNSKIFTEERSDLLTIEEKEQIWNTWKRFLDYVVALESVGRNYRNYSKLSGQLEADAFFTGYAAATVQYRYALDFLHLLSGNGPVAKLLNEAVPELGLEESSFDKFKFRFLNAGRGIEFAARQLVYSSYKRKYTPPAQEKLEAHADAIWEMGKGRGQLMTLKNAVNVVRKIGFSAWLPVQTGVSEWMGDTKVYRVNKSLVHPEQIAALKLEPGDILLERREWYLSNVGLPGFWPHAALYIGTAGQRQNYFFTEEVQRWVREQGEPSGDFDKLLQKTYPEAYERSQGEEHNHPYRVLEAISEGVTFTTLEHSADADSVAVLRPKLDKVAIAVAIYRAFSYAGRPYDFNFDFDTDAALVCTELVSKAYEPNRWSSGLRFPIQLMLGRKVTPANEIVRQFDEQHGTPDQQTSFVCFLDGNEKAKRAVASNLEAFRNSWRRPKWHIITAR